MQMPQLLQAQLCRTLVGTTCWFNAGIAPLSRFSSPRDAQLRNQQPLP